MDIKEVVEKLRSIRERYETGQLSMASANIIGKKYGTRAKLIPNNVKFYPSN